MSSSLTITFLGSANIIPDATSISAKRTNTFTSFPYSPDNIMLPITKRTATTHLLALLSTPAINPENVNDVIINEFTLGLSIA